MLTGQADGGRGGHGRSEGGKSDNDGDISAQEIREVMNKYQIDKTLISELSALCQHMEKDEDMTISLSKFKEYVLPIT